VAEEAGGHRPGAAAPHRGDAGHHLPDARPEFAALGFLAMRPVHGYDLHQLFEARLGKVWRLGQSQLYAVLKRLEAQGLVEAAVEEGRNSLARKVFSTTTAGRVRLDAWLREPSDCSARILRLEFISRLFFARELEPALLLPIVDSQEAELRRHLATHRALLATLAAGDAFNRLGMELKVRQLESLLAWFEESVRPSSALGFPASSESDPQAS
jgi:DNA-binding PadR family transcriptional regulator